MKRIRSYTFTKSLTTFKTVSWMATHFPTSPPLIQTTVQPFGVCGTFGWLFLFYLLKLVLVFGNSPNTWSCLFNYAFTHSALFWVSGRCQAAGSEESDRSKQCKMWVPASTQSNGSFRCNKIESDFYSFICHLSSKNALIGQQLREVFSNYFYDQWAKDIQLW